MLNIDKDNKAIIAKKESRKLMHEDLKELSLQWRANMQEIKAGRKIRKKLIKEDKQNQKNYLKEIKAFEKEDFKNKKSRLSAVEEWYAKVEKNKSNHFIYKYKKSQAKNVNYDFSGDVVFENVTYTYSRNTPLEFNALRQANLTIKKGLITAIIGTTGSGKSTLIQLINGLIIAETGRTIVGNFQLPAATKKIKYVKPLRKEIGLVFQFPEYQLFQESIEKDISFGPITMGIPREEISKRVPELLKMVDLPEDYAERSPFALSGGQKRRVAIAGIIAMDGNTLVLDEPTGGLDPQGEEDFMKIFESLNKEKGKRIIIVTHNMDHVLKIADEVIVMHEGVVKKIGKPFEIFKDTELLKLIDIQPPKLYQLAYKLKDKGIDLTEEEFRNIDEFAVLLKKKWGKK